MLSAPNFLSLYRSIATLASAENPRWPSPKLVRQHLFVATPLVASDCDYEALRKPICSVRWFGYSTLALSSQTIARSTDAVTGPQRLTGSYVKNTSDGDCLLDSNYFYPLRLHLLFTKEPHRVLGFLEHERPWCLD